MVPTYVFMIHNSYIWSCVRFRTSVKCKCGRYRVQHNYLEYNHGEFVIWSTQQNDTNLPPNYQIIYSHFPLMPQYFPRFHALGLRINIWLQCAMLGLSCSSHYTLIKKNSPKKQRWAIGYEVWFRLPKEMMTHQHHAI